MTPEDEDPSKVYTEELNLVVFLITSRLSTWQVSVKTHPLPSHWRLANLWVFNYV